jgi:hypothetical protein
MNLGHSMKSLARSEFVEVERQRWLLIKGPESEGTFEVNCNIGVTRRPFPDFRRHVDPLWTRLTKNLVISTQRPDAIEGYLDP